MGLFMQSSVFRTNRSRKEFPKTITSLNSIITVSNLFFLKFQISNYNPCHITKMTKFATNLAYCSKYCNKFAPNFAMLRICGKGMAKRVTCVGLQL